MAVRENYGDNTLVSGTSDDDDIYNHGQKVTINSGEGDDLIENGIYNYRYNTDNYASNTSINGGNGDDSVKNNKGDNVTINGGNGDDYVYNEKFITNTSISGGAGNDYIKNLGEKVTVLGGTGKDTIKNGDRDLVGTHSYGSKTSLNGGEGDDEIESSSSDVTIIGGDGDDTISNYYRYWASTSISGGAGNDYIYNNGVHVAIDSGNGNDTILNNGDYVTINAGAGNDSIKNSGTGVLFDYSAGDGKDTIYGFNDYSTLQILTDSEVKAKISGDDVIFKVGDTDEAITFKDVLSNDSATIKVLSKSGELTTYTCNKNGTITDDSGGVTLSSPFSGRFDASDYTNVDASNNNLQVKIIGGKENSVTLSGGKANDSIENFTAKSSLFGGKGNDTIYNRTSYTEKKTRNVQVTIQVDVDDYDYVLEPITASEMVDRIDKKITDINNKIKQLRDDAETLRTWAKGSSAADTFINQAKDKEDEAYNLEHMDLPDKQSERKKYAALDPDSTVKSGNTVRQKVGSHKEDSIVPTTEPYTDTIQTNNTGTTIIGGAGDDYVINEAKNFVYSYTVGDGNDTISGFNAASKLHISGGSYTASASGNDIVLKVGSGSITLKDTKGMILNINDQKAFKPAWTLKKTTATYGSAVENLITVKGVKSLDGINLKKKTVTVSNASLNQKKVTVSGSGYNLKLGSDVTKPTTSKAWSLKKSTATYKQTTTAGYTLADNAINYSKKSVEALATIKGAKSTSGLSVSGKKIVLKNSALKSKVTVGGGYEFDFTKDYTQSTISGSTGNDSITTRGKKISVNAGDGNDSIKIFGSATTVAGGKGNDSLWGSSYSDEFIYSAGDGKDVIYGFDDKDTLTLDGLNFKASYKNDAITFKVTGGSIMLKEFTATSFNINGSAYKISGAKLVKK